MLRSAAEALRAFPRRVEFADPERAAAADTLRLVALGVGAVSLAWALLGLVLRSDPWPVGVLTGAVPFAGAVAAWTQARRGRLTAGAVLLLGAVYGAITGGVIASGGLAAAADAAYVIVVVASGLLLGLAGTLACAGLVACTLGVLGLLESQGLLGTVPGTPTPDLWIGHSVVIAVGAALAYAMARRLRTAVGLRREAERALHRRRLELGAVHERFRCVAESTRDLLCETDAKGIVVYASANHAAVLGYAAESLLGGSIAQLIRPEERARAEAEFGRLFAGRLPRPVVFHARRRDGSWCRLEATGSSYRDAEGSLRYVVVSREIGEVGERAEATAAGDAS